jgi:hypothetical protein
VGAVLTGRWLPDLAEGRVAGIALLVTCGLTGMVLALVAVHVYEIGRQLTSASSLGVTNSGISRAASSRCRGRAIALATLSCAVAIAACGSSGPTSNCSGPTAQSKKAGALDFAKCMRAHGVPNFPDPIVSGHSVQLLGSGSAINPRSPAFQSAQTSCQHLLPGGGPGAGPPSARAHAQLLQISEYMRRHGISSFPDPQRGSPPSKLAGYSAILGHGGYLLTIPSSIDMSSPAFKQAAATCNFGPRGGPRPAA